MIYEYQWEKCQYCLGKAMQKWCEDNIPKDDWDYWWQLGAGGFTFSTQEQLDKFTEVWKNK